MSSNNSNFNHIMVDIETGGTSPDRTPILQIAAVRFDLENQTVCPEVFEACLTVPGHRLWDEGTRNWWNNQKASILQDIRARARPHREVINEFFDWAIAHPATHFWAKPISFDYPFLQSYFADEGLRMPWHFRMSMDVNTFLRTLHMPHEVPDLGLPNDGDAHNALVDVIYQIRLVFAHYALRKEIQG